MADPLRRTILAKLRGKKPKKGAPAGGGHGGPAAPAEKDGEGKDKVFPQQQNSETDSVFLITELDRRPLTERMSTYENLDNKGAVVELGGFLVRESSCAVLAGARPPCEVSGRRREKGEPHADSGSGDHVNEELMSAPLPLQRDCGRDPIHHHEPYALGKASVLPMGKPVADPHARRKHLTRQYIVGDSIGFGDNYNRHVYHTTRLHSNSAEVVESSALDADGVCLDQEARVHRHRNGDRCLRVRHMAESVAAVNERIQNADSNFDSNRPINTNSPPCTTLMHPTCGPGYCLAGSNTEETILIRNIESYCSSEYSGNIRLINLQSPTYFPTESQINMSSLCATEGSPIRHSLGSDDEDYYDNEILPFYKNVRAGANDTTCVKNHAEVQSGKDQCPGVRDSIQETDRLRSQLKEAYYLLINAMHDINLDVQQHSAGLGGKQQTYSSCSSPSRDSLGSRPSVKNMDSDSWSSGRDSNLNLLCVSRSPESRRRGSDPTDCRSMVHLLTGTNAVWPPIPRSASDVTISYHRGSRGPVNKGGSGGSSPKVCEDFAVAEPMRAEEEKGVRRGDQLADQATSSEEQPQDGEDEAGSGMLGRSGGSLASLTGSSDNNNNNNLDAPLPNVAKDPTGVQTLAATTSASLARQGQHHGVTVNKMQEWMHRGRLLSSEMKQRIEGSSSSSSSSSSSPRGSQGQDKAGEQEPLRGTHRVKPLSPSCGGGKPAPKSPRRSTASSPQQQPGRRAPSMRAPKPVDSVRYKAPRELFPSSSSSDHSFILLHT